MFLSLFGTIRPLQFTVPKTLIPPLQATSPARHPQADNYVMKKCHPAKMKLLPCVFPCSLSEHCRRLRRSRTLGRLST
ncbi:hypothetical protein B0G74_3232 [Paraburkholderia sp. BL9I2N2]|nr:hypothetical protein B0G74_3232 [Paraburkholderia sp. BL9I2N2]